MAGVIVDGQQWEHCGDCGKFVRFPQNLGYQPPNDQFQYGRMLCIECANKLPQEELDRVQPAPEWQPVYEEVQ